MNRKTEIYAINGVKPSPDLIDFLKYLPWLERSPIIVSKEILTPSIEDSLRCQTITISVNSTTVFIESDNPATLTRIRTTKIVSIPRDTCRSVMREEVKERTSTTRAPELRTFQNGAKYHLCKQMTVIRLEPAQVEEIRELLEALED